MVDSIKYNIKVLYICYLDISITLKKFYGTSESTWRYQDFTLKILVPRGTKFYIRKWIHPGTFLRLVKLPITMTLIFMEIQVFLHEQFYSP